MRDLQHRLGAAGFDVPSVEAGEFADATEHALRAFQDARGLRVDGRCGPQTWAALVESGFTLGDRLLYLRRPMLRGDDVADLQRRLNGLGFDAGREDGILGPETASAVGDFQRNAGLATDGILGPSTKAAIERLGTLADGSVAAVRERETLRHGRRGIDGRRVYVAVAPGFEALGRSVEGALATLGAHTVLDASGASDTAVAAAANRFDADLFLALRAGEEPGCRCAYFATGRFRSEAGFHAASSLLAELSPLLAAPPEPLCGKAYALLRETRMAAVVLELVAADDVGGMGALVGRFGDVGRAIGTGVRRTFEHPPGSDPPAADPLTRQGP